MIRLTRTEYDAVLDHIHGAWEAQNPLMWLDAMRHLDIVEIARLQYPLNPHSEVAK